MSLGEEELGSGRYTPIQHESFATAEDRKQIGAPAHDTSIESVTQTAGEFRALVSSVVPTETTAASAESRIYLAPAPAHRKRRYSGVWWTLGALSVVLAGSVLYLARAHAIATPIQRTPLPAARLVAAPRQVTHAAGPAPAGAWTFAAVHTPIDQRLVSLYNPNPRSVDAVVQAGSSLPIQVQVPRQGSAELNLGQASGAVTVRASAPITSQVVQIAGTTVTTLPGTPLRTMTARKP